MLDNTTIDYILDYYSRFMTLKEVAAMKHYMTSFKFPKTAPANGDTKNLLLEKGWLSNDKDVAELLKDGYKQFRQNTAERILKENKKKFISTVVQSVVSLPEHHRQSNVAIAVIVGINK